MSHIIQNCFDWLSCHNMDDILMVNFLPFILCNCFWTSSYNLSIKFTSIFPEVQGVFSLFLSSKQNEWTIVTSMHMIISNLSCYFGLNYLNTLILNVIIKIWYGDGVLSFCLRYLSFYNFISFSISALDQNAVNRGNPSPQ